MNFIVRRKLNDFNSWKQLVSQPDGLRRQYGSKGATVFRNAKVPNEVYLVFDWDDDRPYAEYLRLPEVQKALAETGTNEVIEVGESFRLDE